MGVNDRLNIVEEKISELEGTAIKTNQNETQNKSISEYAIISIKIPEW